MVCENGHESTIGNMSLHQKFKILEEKDETTFCAECRKPEICVEEQKSRDKCEELGFTFIHFKKREVKYQCVCGHITTTYCRNLLREERKAHCLKCQNDRFKNTNVEQAFKEEGCELLSEYKSKDKPVEYRCNCGRIATIRYSDFKKGKRCWNCKTIKYKETCKEKHGVENMFQLENIKQKSRETCKKKFGVEYCMQSPDIQSKALASSFKRNKIVKFKDYKWTVQGYEPYCIDDLLEIYEPDDIIAGLGMNVPSINYFFEKDRVWHPDVWIPSRNLIIEVKSTYTYNKNPEQLKAKVMQCPYDCELHIYNRDGTMLESITKYGDKIDYKFGKFVFGRTDS